MLIAHVIRDKGAVVHTLPAEATLEQAARNSTREEGRRARRARRRRRVSSACFPSAIWCAKSRAAARHALSTTVGAAMSREVITAARRRDDRRLPGAHDRPARASSAGGRRGPAGRHRLDRRPGEAPHRRGRRPKLPPCRPISPRTRPALNRRCGCSWAAAAPTYREPSVAPHMRLKPVRRIDRLNMLRLSERSRGLRGRSGRAKITLIFQVFFEATEKCVFCAKRSLTRLRGAHRNRAFRRDLERFRPARVGLRLCVGGLRGTSPREPLSGAL